MTVCSPWVQVRVTTGVDDGIGPPVFYSESLGGVDVELLERRGKSGQKAGPNAGKPAT
jgi:hypothetical protein